MIRKSALYMPTAEPFADSTIVSLERVEQSLNSLNSLYDIYKVAVLPTVCKVWPNSDNLTLAVGQRGSRASEKEGVGA